MPRGGRGCKERLERAEKAFLQPHIVLGMSGCESRESILGEMDMCAEQGLASSSGLGNFCKAVCLSAVCCASSAVAQGPQQLYDHKFYNSGFRPVLPSGKKVPGFLWRLLGRACGRPRAVEETGPVTEAEGWVDGWEGMLNNSLQWNNYSEE